MLIEDWQVEKETADYLYVNINIGLERAQRKSAIKIPARCVDKLENGNYQVFLKKQDRFYFVDSKNPENNKIMLGKTVAKNLQKERTDLHKTLKQVEKEMLYYDKSVDRYEDYQQEQTKNKSQHSPRL
ncbi:MULTISPECIES: hypothetical protein [Lactococcus]|uniref:hypothetical protein n=1 Tax=Lactococcus TaxID=1357 RepID=UPI0022E42385|nr:hypothetical protein [Lactococcus petauri]